MTAIPQHPIIGTRRAVEARQQTRAGRFQPVVTPSYRPRPHTVLARYWRAVGPSLIGLGLFIIAAATLGGWIAVVVS